MPPPPTYSIRLPVHPDDRFTAENERLRAALIDALGRNCDLVAAVGDYENWRPAFSRLFHVWLALVARDVGALEAARTEIDHAIEALFEQERAPC